MLYSRGAKYFYYFVLSPCFIYSFIYLIGIDFKLKMFTIRDKRIRLQIW